MKKTSTVIWRALRGIKISRYIHKSSPSNKGHSRVFGGAQRSGIFDACRGRVPFVKQPYVEDPRLQPSGMTALCDNGFTLVELLVVVLIIGVLTAVAVPMYQSAVDKSHFSTMLPSARAIKNAEEAYWLANGYYTNDETSLDVSAPAEDVTFSYEVKGEDGGTHNVIRATNSKLSNVRLASYLDDNTQYAGQLHCEAATGNERANKLCGKTLLGTQIKEINTGYMSYLLNQEMDQPTCGDAGMSWSTSKEHCYKTNHERCTALGMPELNTTQCGYENDRGSDKNHLLTIGAEGICLGTAGSWSDCAYLDVKEGGLCQARVDGSCSSSTIENGGKCEVTSTGGMSSCTSLTVEAGGICEVNDSMSGCHRSNINGGIVICNTPAYSMCGYDSSFNGGVCVSSDTNGSCFASEFTNHSICYANNTRSCGSSEIYDDTSCCCSLHGYCPAGTACADTSRCDPQYMK